MYKAANEQVTIPTKTDLMHPLDTDDTCISIDLSLQFRLHAKWAIFQLYHVENKSRFNEMVIMSVLFQTNTIS